MVGFPTYVKPYLPMSKTLLAVKSNPFFRVFPFNYCHKKYAVFVTKKLRFITSCNGVSHWHASVGGSASGKWSAGGETAGTEPERNELAVPPTEAGREAIPHFLRRDERAWSAAEGGCAYQINFILGWTMRAIGV
jgi:hypothetical protein